MHTHAHTHKHIHMHLHKHACTRIHTHINTQWRYTCEHMHMHINPHMHKHTYPHKCMHTHTHNKDECRAHQVKATWKHFTGHRLGMLRSRRVWQGLWCPHRTRKSSERLECGVWGKKAREETGGPVMSLTDMGVHREATWMGWGGGGKIILFGTGFSLTTCLFIFLPKQPERAPPKALSFDLPHFPERKMDNWAWNRIMLTREFQMPAF